MLGISSQIKRNPDSGSKIVIGTAETSTWIAKNAKRLGLDKIKRDGFIIKTVDSDNAKVLVIAALIPAGVSFGTFDSDTSYTDGAGL